MPGGDGIQVKSQTMELYKKLALRYFLDEMDQQEFSQFSHGFSRAIRESRMLALFSDKEMKEVVRGKEKIQREFIRKHAFYEPSFSQDPVVDNRPVGYCPEGGKRGGQKFSSVMDWLQHPAEPQGLAAEDHPTDDR